MPSTQRADRLLCCAIAYHSADVEPKPLPARFDTVDEAVASFMNCLWVEANDSLREPIVAPPEAYLHPVDIGTDEPGIVTSKAAKTNEVHRRKAPFPKVLYEKRSRKAPIAYKTSPPKSLEAARAEAAKLAVARVEENTKRAAKDIKAERRSLDALERREAKKLQRENETKEERQERLEEQRLKREERKRQKEMEKLAEEARSAEAPSEAASAEEAPASADDQAPADEPPTDGAQTPAAEEAATGAIAVGVEELLEHEAEGCVDAQAVLPQRVTAKVNKKTKFYASPVPFDRHMGALEEVGLSDELGAAVLSARPSPNLQIVEGPPGTGKTWYLAHKVLTRFADARILACAPTNVGAANLYTRILEVDPSAALLLPPSRVPPDTPITNQSPHARIVCSTISGRAGSLLDAEEFDVIIVDEAAQCMEAWMWALLRPRVKHLIMAGDRHQLPALVSEHGQAARHDRSMMERLLDAGYASTFLSEQRRMHPEIVAFPNAAFYDGKLRTSYVSHPDTADVAPFQVVGVEGECVARGTSYLNEVEAQAVFSIATALKERFARVVIISPYQAQTRALLAMGFDNVHTVDSFQGQEADAVVLSVVRERDVGFWNDYRRLNVAMTRAKHCLRVVGHASKWTGLLARVRTDAETRGHLVLHER